jgi:uncharacterized MAPEG superfamily protein
LVYIGVASTAAKRQTGIAWAAGPRDRTIELTGVAGRLDRAQRNFFESFPLFAALVLVVHVSGRSNDWSLVGAQLYFWSRVAYLPIYALGWPWIRTAVWQIGMIGMVGMIVALFP